MCLPSNFAASWAMEATSCPDCKADILEAGIRWYKCSFILTGGPSTVYGQACFNLPYPPEEFLQPIQRSLFLAWPDMMFATTEQIVSAAEHDTTWSAYPNN